MLFRQKTAYDMLISDVSSDVCSSDLLRRSPSSRLRRGEGLMVAIGRFSAHSGRLFQIDVAQIGLEGAEALREAALRLLVGQFRRDDDLFARIPVHRGRDRTSTRLNSSH